MSWFFCDLNFSDSWRRPRSGSGDSCIDYQPFSRYVIAERNAQYAYFFPLFPNIWLMTLLHPVSGIWICRFWIWPCRKDNISEFKQGASQRGKKKGLPHSALCICTPLLSHEHPSKSILKSPLRRISFPYFPFSKLKRVVWQEKIRVRRSLGHLAPLP